MKIVEINCETGEEIVRDANKSELIILKERQEQFQAEMKMEIEKAAAREALLERLGLTADEAKLLLG
jgi:hypothetical protein